MNEKKADKKGVKILVVGIAIIVAVVLLFLLFQSPIVQRAINPPNVEVISKSASDGLEGLDYVVYVHATVFNHGGSGQVTVWAEVQQGGNTWKKAQTISIDSKQSMDLTFKFKEVAFWSLESCYYRVWVE